jgi:beta-galactosidase
MKRYKILYLSFFCLFFSCMARHAEIRSGKVWNDTAGNQINAHGGCVLYHEGVYYWYGEFKGDSTYRLQWVKTWECWRAEAGGISCYSSYDLVNWKFEGIVLPPLPDDPTSDLHPSQVIERPKVIYNEKTKTFVMWMHIDSPDYEKAHAGVAVSDSPTGRFRYLGSFKPNGRDSRDQTLFKDDDGRAYQICSSDWNKSLNINLLNDDYTRPTGTFRQIMVQESREAPALFKRQGKYYLITSGCTGWDPNTAASAVADSVFGIWTSMGNPCAGKDSDSTFYAQSAYVLRVEGKKNLYIAMFDRWNKTNLIDSRYIWLPISFRGEKPQIAWKNQWQILDSPRPTTFYEKFLKIHE